VQTNNATGYHFYGGGVAVTYFGGITRIGTPTGINANTDMFSVFNNTNANISLWGNNNTSYRSYNANAGPNNSFNFYTSLGNLTVPTAMSLSTNVGTIGFLGYDGASYRQGASIGAFVDGTVTVGSTPTRISFFTQVAGSSALPERMRISSTGAVMIGTTTETSTAQLEVSSTSKGFLPPRLNSTQASAIASPAEGLLIYVTSTNGTFTAKGWWGYNGAAWEKLNN
jgi:hypothetical protein